MYNNAILKEDYPFMERPRRGENNMPVSKAQQRATAKYEAKVYDKLLLRLPKGQKEIIQDHAATVGESVNGYIVKAISRRMEAEAPPVGDMGTSSGDGLAP